MMTTIKTGIPSSDILSRPIVDVGLRRPPLSLLGSPGVDILQKMPKNTPGGINSTLAKFPYYSKLSGSNPKILR